MNQVNYNLLAGLISTIIGIIYTIMSITLPNATIGNPIEPKIFPMLLGVGMTICGIILTIMEGRKKTVTKKTKNDQGLSHDTKLIIYTCIVTLAYALLFEPIGYVLSTIAFMSAMLFALNGKEKWKTNIIVSLSFSIGIYFLFLKLLSIPLPMMPFIQI